MDEPHAVERFPLSRLGTFDVGVIGAGKHQITGLLEIDVTTMRSLLRRRRRTGDAVSFFACFIKTVATTIREEPRVHAVLRGRRRRVMFEAVDIAVLVERVIEGVPVPVPLVIRGAERLGLQEIESTIVAAMHQPIDGPGDYELGRRRAGLTMAVYYRLPQALRVLVLKAILRNPFRRKRMMGTVVVTSLSSTSQVPGWILPRSMHNLSFGVGAVVRKPWIVGNEIVPREILHLTVSFDHDVIDGAPAARFLRSVTKRLQRADVLSEDSP